MVEYQGWKGIENGEMLALADAEFDALLTADRKLPEEQDLTGLRRLGIVRLVGTDITLVPLIAATQEILRAFQRLQPGSVETVQV